MAEYRLAMKKYKDDLAAWESLTEEEKTQANREAESSSIGFFAGLGGAAIGGIGWLISYDKWRIDGLVGLAMVAFGAFIFTTFDSARVISGRLFRATTFSPLIYLFFAAIVFFLSVVSDFVESHSSLIYKALVPISLAISFFSEFKGDNHASAKPVEPTVPSP